MKNKLYLLLLISSLPFSMLSGQVSNRFYVDEDAVAGNNTGQSWENAYTNLQQALLFSVSGDTIWVAEGTYFPTTGENRTASFKLKLGVAIYGGFTATETSLAERNLWEHPTILSGDIGIVGDSTDNVYHVVKALGVDSTTLIDGFVIEYGQADNPDNAATNIDNKGGGMFITGSETVGLSSPKIANCTFRLNVGKLGAGVYLKSASADETLFIIENCKFEQNNSFFNGGGLYVDAILSPDAELWLKRDTFLNNIAIEGGGASLYDLRSLRADSCIFNANEVANHGGGIAYLNSIREARVQVNHSRFERNKARVYGGFLFTPTGFGTILEDSLFFSFDHCIFLENQASHDVGSALSLDNLSRYQKVEISNSLFEGNFPDDAIYGTFWENSESDWKIDKCVFKNNAPFPMSYGGGAINFKGKLSYGSKKVTTTITNSIFTGNGGAISVSAGVNGQFDTYIKNCTFFNNGRYAIAKTWGEVYNDSTWYNNLEISNSILWEEETQLPGLQSILYNGDPNSLSIYDYRVSHTAVSAAGCVEFGSEEACGEGMVFGIYPEFLDTLNGDLQLSACSPLLNIGSNIGLDSLNAFTDILGASRIQDSIVDLGAYERATFSVVVDTLADPSCIGQADGFVSFDLNGTAPYDYVWLTDSIEGVALEMLNAADYSFIVTDATNCQDTIALTLADPLPIAIEAMVNPASQISGGSITILETIGGTPPYAYLWSTGAIGTTISDLSIGTYSLTVTDANGCEALWEYEVMLVNSQQEPLEESEFVVYPNPVPQGGELQLRYPHKQKNATVRLYDRSGKLIAEHEQPIDRISTNGLTLGVYWLTLMNENGEVLEKRGFVVY